MRRSPSAGRDGPRFASPDRLCLGDKKEDWTGARTVSAVNAGKGWMGKVKAPRRRRRRGGAERRPVQAVLLLCTAACLLGDSPRRREAPCGPSALDRCPVISSVPLSPHRVYVTGEE